MSIRFSKLLVFEHAEAASASSAATTNTVREDLPRALAARRSLRTVTSTREDIPLTWAEAYLRELKER
ncbi:MAG TPA: hypothetical protein VFT80_15445 [Actinomycetota bacterium]|nr:hypothetical protein [Actinomycetota bacterium]